ncbi:uncharacterized protein LOC124809272 [Hydra vulgaris]|uniref:uncharacterized protein LOC124809272 n=1 Tax=Hydra vulgaris TaxID=6087 RepID=UPI0032E9DA3E
MGKTKPDSLNEYLDQFITEAKELLLQGILFNGAHYTIQIGAFVCDAPARAFLKNIKLHSGYSACKKCVVESEWSGRVIYTDVNCQLRTNEVFAAMDDQEHHKGSTPLLELGIGIVTNFPIDYMHLVCKGVVGKLVKQWIGKGGLMGRYPAKKTAEISDKLISMAKDFPTEFSRKPRAI